MHFSKVAILVLGSPNISEYKDLGETNNFRGGPNISKYMDQREPFGGEGNNFS